MDARETRQSTDGPLPDPPAARRAGWLAGLAALGVLLLTFSAWLARQAGNGDPAEDFLRLVVVGPPHLTEGAASHWRISTSSMVGEGVPASVELVLCDGSGKILHREESATDESGQLALAVPIAAPRTSTAEVQIRATHGPAAAEGRWSMVVRPPEFLCHLWLDQPHYRPGQPVHYRAVVLRQDRFTVPADRAVAMVFEVLDARGRPVEGSTTSLLCRGGVARGTWTLPAELPAGRYTLSARGLSESVSSAGQSFEVRPDRPGAFQVRVQFLSETYEPGQRVQAEVEVQTSRGQPAADIRLQLAATVDGQQVWQHQDRTGAAGTCRIEFPLPESVEQGGELAVEVHDGDTREAVVQPIPFRIQRTDLQFFPEGGELIAGLENRVYFSARGAGGRPVEVEGRVVDADGQTAAPLRTESHGRGMFRFVPKADTVYTLQLETPPQTEVRGALPAAREDRHVVLSAGRGVFESSQPIECRLRANRANLPLLVALDCRGRLVAQHLLVSRHGPQSLALSVPAGVGGVLRLTVWDYSAAPPVPLAQRLVYRFPDRTLTIAFEDLPAPPTAGQSVSLRLNIRNELGQPVPAVLGARIVAEDAPGAPGAGPHLPAQFLLAGDLAALPAHENLDSFLRDTAEARQALDLLLATQPQRPAQSDPADAPGPATSAGGQSGARLVAPPLLDNLPEILPRYEQRLQAAQHHLAQRLGVLALFSAGVLLVFAAVMALLWTTPSVFPWALVSGIAAVCGLVAAGTIQPEATAGPASRVAFHGYPPPADAEVRVQPPSDEPPQPEQPEPSTTPDADPHARGWYPRLMADEQGQAILEFEPGEMSKTYRVQVDAHDGQGRLGHGEHRLETQP